MGGHGQGRFPQGPGLGQVKAGGKETKGGAFLGAPWRTP